MRMRHVLSAKAAIALLISAACSPSPASTPTTAPVARISIGYSSVIATPSAMWVAQEAGFLKRNGLLVEDLIPYRGGAGTVEALASGDIEFAVVSPSAVVDDPVNGAIMIAGLVNTLSYNVVVQSGITGGGGLKGKRFGVSGQAGSSATATRYALRELFGLDPDRDVTIVSIGNEEDRLAALQTGQIDGTVLVPELAPRAKRMGLVVLATLWDKGIAYQFTGAAVSRAYASKNPETVRAFVKSVVEAIAYYKDPGNEEAVKKVLVKYLKTSDAEYVAASHASMATTLLQQAPYVSEEGTKTLIAESRAATARGVRASDVTDNSYVRELDESGFIKGLYK